MVDVLISRKRCKLETLLVRTNNRTFYIAYQIVTNSMNLSDFKVTD